jgi:hypothetical protein
LFTHVVVNRHVAGLIVTSHALFTRVVHPVVVPMQPCCVPPPRVQRCRVFPDEPAVVDVTKRHLEVTSRHGLWRRLGFPLSSRWSVGDVRCDARVPKVADGRVEQPVAIAPADGQRHVPISVLTTMQRALKQIVQKLSPMRRDNRHGPCTNHHPNATRCAIAWEYTSWTRGSLT